MPRGVYERSEYEKERCRRMAKTAGLGSHHTQEWKDNMSQLMSGKNHPMYGKRPSNERIEKARQSMLGKNTGPNNGMWVGDNISRKAVHRWVRKHLPIPKVCQRCNLVPPYDLANVTGVYSRDFNNWRYWCRRCHMIDDGRLKSNKWIKHISD